MAFSLLFSKYLISNICYQEIFTIVTCVCFSCSLAHIVDICEVCLHSIYSPFFGYQCPEFPPHCFSPVVSLFQSRSAHVIWPWPIKVPPPPGLSDWLGNGSWTNHSQSRLILQDFCWNEQEMGVEGRKGGESFSSPYFFQF